MSYWRRITGIQSAIGLAFLIVFVVVAAVAFSWGITCLFVYWISLLWVGTPWAFTWSWEFATGVWLALCLIGGFCSARINFNE